MSNAGHPSPAAEVQFAPVARRRPDALTQAEVQRPAWQWVVCPSGVRALDAERVSLRYKESWLIAEKDEMEGRVDTLT
jgi:hypothetical protein